VEKGLRMRTELIPPVELIAANNVGIHDKANVLQEYERVGAYIANTLKAKAMMGPESNVLDMGCGLGRVTAHLVDYLTTGTYTGVDVVKSSIDWCEERYASYPNFRFIHANLFSKWYNPEGTETAETYRFPFPDNSFDVIWSSSLFTHMLMPAVEHYITEMVRVCRPGGYIWNTYLLLDEISEPLVLGPRGDGRRMMHKVEGGRVGYLDKPEHVVGLDKDRILEAHRRNGFEIVDVSLTNWSGGRPEVQSRGQDAILARKAS
jgi:ubiquinone/menaquinone biosynthesis C-methylase UbiE